VKQNISSWTSQVILSSPFQRRSYVAYVSRLAQSCRGNFDPDSRLLVRRAMKEDQPETDRQHFSNDRRAVNTQVGALSFTAICDCSMSCGRDCHATTAATRPSGRLDCWPNVITGIFVNQRLDGQIHLRVYANSTGLGTTSR
jgi:hypothetical protein